MSQNKEPRPSHTFIPELKQQIIHLYRGGKRECDIIEEYDIASSLLDKRITQSGNSGFFKERDNHSTGEDELIILCEENQRLRWTALILGEKVIVIRANAHKYSVSAMCSVLQIPRNT